MPIKAGFSLEPATVERINKISSVTRLDKSAVVDKAVELLATQDEFAHLQTDVATPRKPDLADIPVQKGIAA